MDGSVHIKAPPIGHNQPPEPTPYEAAVERLDDLTLEAKNWLDGSGVQSASDADAVSALMDHIRRARTDTDAARKVEAKPFDDGKAEVQARYNPLLKNADLAVDACKAALTPWLQRVEAEKRATAEAARRDADEKARAAAAAVQAADATDLDAREEAEQQVADAKRAEAAAKRAEKDRAQSHGGARATTLRSSWKPLLVDARAAARHYWTTNYEDLEALFTRLAEADVRAGKRTIPGFEVVEQRAVV